MSAQRLESIVKVVRHYPINYVNLRKKYKRVKELKKAIKVNIHY
jgi:hypothetical protein